MNTKPTTTQNALKLLKKWHETEAKVRLYGVAMPQAQQAIEAFYDCLRDPLALNPSLSFIKRNQIIEVAANRGINGRGHSACADQDVNTEMLSQMFETFKIRAVTFYRNLTSEELIGFFTGLRTCEGEASKPSSLKAYLKKQHISHIQITWSHQDHGKGTKACTDTEQTSLAAEAKRSGSAHPVNASVTAERFDSAWERYLSNELDATDLILEHSELIELAQKHPDRLVRALKNIVAKQQEIETFLASLEQKLFDVGFSGDAIQDIHEGLMRPQQVLIGEDELSRLRQVEREFRSTRDGQATPSLGRRLERSLETIETLEKRLSDVKERGEAVVRQTSQGVMALDKAGRILKTNDIADKVLGLSGREATGKFINEVLKDHHMLAMVGDWEQETEAFTPKHVTVQASDSRTMDTIRESSLVLEDVNGRSVGGIYALQDVTKQRALETRTNDILDVLGHDLRSPLAVVKQYISLMIDSQKRPQKLSGDKQDTLLKTCARHVMRLENLVNKILDVRQLETGKVILKKCMTNPNTIIADAAGSLDSWAKAKHMKVEMTVDPLPEIDCDPERLYQVVTNLVSNAIKYSNEGGTVTVEGRGKQTEGCQAIEISVIDSGIGIAQEDLDRVFNKYEQVSLQSPAGTSGLGLGLYTCKSIVELHGGRIWARRNHDSGSTFTFELPIEPEAIRPSDEPCHMTERA